MKPVIPPHWILLSFLFIWITCWALSARAESGMIEVGFQNSPVQIEVVEYSRSMNGDVIPSRIQVTEANGDTQTLAVHDAGNPTVRLALAARLKVPELVGLRAGLRYGNFAELGVDLGTSLVVTGIGVYGQVHPFDDGFYIGGKFYRSAVFAIFSFKAASAVEGIVGWRWGAERSGLFGFAELGVSDIYCTEKTVIENGIEKKCDANIVVPVLALGMGWQF